MHCLLGTSASAPLHLWLVSIMLGLNVGQQDQAGLLVTGAPLSVVQKAKLFLTLCICTGVEPLRALSGAGINTRDNPPSLREFDPSNCHSGGLFDSKKHALARAQKV